MPFDPLNTMYAPCSIEDNYQQDFAFMCLVTPPVTKLWVCSWDIRSETCLRFSKHMSWMFFFENQRRHVVGVRELSCLLSWLCRVFGRRRGSFLSVLVWFGQLGACDAQVRSRKVGGGACRQNMSRRLAAVCVRHLRVCCWACLNSVNVYH